MRPATGNFRSATSSDCGPGATAFSPRRTSRPVRWARKRHKRDLGPAGSGALDGAVRHVRTFGPIQRAEVALAATGGETVIEIDAPRDRELQIGDIVGLRPRRYRIFAAQD